MHTLYATVLTPKVSISISKLQYGVWKSQKKSHSTLRAERATFTFWVDKSLLKCQKWSIYFWKTEVVLPDMSDLTGQKFKLSNQNFSNFISFTLNIEYPSNLSFFKYCCVYVLYVFMKDFFFLSRYLVFCWLFRFACSFNCHLHYQITIIISCREESAISADAIIAIVW